VRGVQGPRRRRLRPVVTHARRHRHQQLHLGTIASRALRALGHRGLHDVGQVLHAVKRVDVDSITQLARHAEHVGSDGGDVDRRSRILDRPGRPHRIEQCQLVVRAAVVERRFALECAEEGSQCGDVVAHARARRVELRPVSPGDVRPDLGADAEPEAAAARVLELPGGRGRDRRAAREGDGDAGGELQTFGGQGRRRHREEGRATGLGEGDAAEPGALDIAGEALDRVKLARAAHQVDTHARPPSPIAVPG